MFDIAILIGIYTYTIFLLGMVNLLYKSIILSLTFIYFVAVLIYYRRNLYKILRIISFSNVFSLLYAQLLKKSLQKNLFFSVIALIFFLQSLINLVGAFGPELAFDALWYHLTLPKIYLSYHQIMYIPGGLLYYSAMPKLGEMLYTAALAFSGENLAKLIHFSFGILTCVGIYQFSRKYFSPLIAIIALVVFYSNLVVAWQSITAYIDLIRTFFELLALWRFIQFTEKRQYLLLFESAIFVGLAISVKLLAIASLFIFTILLVMLMLREKYKIKQIIIYVGSYIVISLFIPLPWFIFSYIHTGNLIYPFFTDLYKVGLDVTLLHPLQFIADMWKLFARLEDPISPIYVLLLPFLLFTYPRLPSSVKIIVLYSLLSIIMWYITPRTGGGRFILPYLPAFSLVAASTINRIITYKAIKPAVLACIMIIASITVVYRGIANAKYLPVIFGQASKQDFLSSHLNFSFGDFYDTDGYFARNIKEKDTVLLYGFHNLYYVYFPFVNSSWVNKGDKFSYIAVQNGVLPNRFSHWNLIYHNKKTGVNVYSLGGKSWVY